MGLDSFSPFSLIPSLVDTGIGIFEKSKADKALNELSNTPYPEFQLTPQLSNAYARSEQMAKQGFSGAETGAFNQKLAQQGNLAYQRGVNIAGGGQAQALNAGINAMQLPALNQFAGQDAMLHRQNIKYSDTLSQALQHQQNLQTQNEIARRNALEQSYGRAGAAGLSNIGTGLNFGGAMLNEQYNQRLPQGYGYGSYPRTYTPTLQPNLNTGGGGGYGE